jgi:predicted methyltransferase
MIAKHCLFFATLAMCVAACHKVDPESAPPAALAKPSADAVAAAVANPNRLQADLEEDSWRKPAELLQLLELRPGAQVIDYFSAGGYFTELLSYVVGPQGKVIAFNNEPYRKFAGKQPEQRYGNGRLPNVIELTALPEALELQAQSLDGALFMLSYHDLYWRPADGGWPPTDAAQALQRLVPALKSEALVLVVDHAAAAGSDAQQSVTALHRIDPAIVKRDFEAAGLRLESESSTLRNLQDDYGKAVFDPAVQHRTDRFVYRFRKP